MTPAEQKRFARHLRKTIKEGKSAGERVQATKLLAELFGETAALPDGTGTGDIALPELQSPNVTAKTKRQPSEFDEMCGWRDVTSLMYPVRALVAEAQAFVCWRRDMGENEISSPLWGDWQRTYSADLHIKHRAAAAQLNAEIAAGGRDVKRFWDDLFAGMEQRYPVEVRQQARIALGV